MVNQLGRAVSEKRWQMHLSTREVSARSHVSQLDLEEFEHGDLDIDILTLSSIASILDVEVSQLLSQAEFSKQRPSLQVVRNKLLVECWLELANQVERARLLCEEAQSSLATILMNKLILSQLRAEVLRQRNQLVQGRALA